MKLVEEGARERGNDKIPDICKGLSRTFQLDSEVSKVSALAHHQCARGLVTVHCTSQGVPCSQQHVVELA